MRKFKATIAIILIVLMLCSGGYLVYFFSKDSENKKVITTILPIYDICRELLGATDDLKLLENTGVDMHSYQPTAMDITAISKSELFIYIGGESDEKWVDGVLKSASNVNLSSLRLMDVVEGLEESEDGIVGGEHYDHEEEREFDEHIWLSIKNMKKMTNAILSKLIEVFPHREMLLRENASEYISKLDDLDVRYDNTFAMQTSTVVVADRFPFRYLFHDYNIEFLAAYQGCSADVRVTPEVIVALRDKVNDEELNYLCVLETSDKAIANTIKNDSSCRPGVEVEILTINSCQAVNNREIEKVSYLEIMESNLINLKRAITNEIN